MTILHGFILIRETEIPELHTKARLFRHQKSGARLLSLENDDENKVFGINFRTPPPDSTGLPHIMEHSVLCGSRRFPVREPFVELIKGSLQTFVNAFTFSDKTCYPVASQNVSDFYNLIDVYMDAVLYPLIPPRTLEQEGWHYEIDSPEAEINYKGVVFNEMKGAYSSPDGVMGRDSQQLLFKDHVYGLDSGGDPAVMPDLTYSQFKGFHDTYYHPSNAYIFLYGDDDPDQRLSCMDGYLKDFEVRPVDSQIPLMPRLAAPQRYTRPYDAGKEAGGEKPANGKIGRKHMLTVNWMLGEVDDPEFALSMIILSHILIGTPASPLRKALIDSGLGEDLVGVGLDDDLRQAMFSTGLKGVAQESVEQVEALILKTLADLASSGIDPETISASINTVEFRRRENNTGAFPRGIALMLRALTTWLYEGDPIVPLAFEAPLNSLKLRLTSGEKVFESLIKQYFLDNPHRVTVILEPDSTLSESQEKAERERLANFRANLTQDELGELVERTLQLKLHQETPDSAEALATIPSLQLTDLDPQVRIIPIEEIKIAGVSTYFHDLFTNGILYLDLGLDLHQLPQELLPFVPLFGRALLEMGVGDVDFVKLSQRIGRNTGGIRATPVTTTRFGQGSGVAYLFIRGKATASQAHELLAILRDVLLDARLDNRERFQQIVMEEKANREASLIPAGHQVVNSRLRALFTEADWASEQMGGVSYLFFLRKLAEEVDKDWPTVLARLEMIRQALVNQSILCNVTIDRQHWQAVQANLEQFLTRLPFSPSRPLVWKPELTAPFEGLTIPAQVNYVGKGANLYELGYKLDGSVLVIRNYLRVTWLWEKVRVQGGAYGGFCQFDPRSGVFTYLSYRDPNLLQTIEIYDHTSQFLRELKLSKEELDKSIIGAIGEMDSYQLPDAKGFTSLMRLLAQETDEDRQRLRQGLLGTTLEDFRAFGSALEQIASSGKVVVLGSLDAIQAANQERGGWLEVIKVL